VPAFGNIAVFSVEISQNYSQYYKIPSTDFVC